MMMMILFSFLGSRREREREKSVEWSRCLVVCCSVKILSEDQKMTQRIVSYVCCLVVLLLLLLLLKLFKSTHYFYRSILFYSSLFCSYHKSHEYFYSKPSVRRGVFFSPPALKKGIAFPSSLSSSSFPSPGFLFPNLAEVDGTICFIEGVRSRADRDGVRLLEVIRRSD